MGKAIYKTLKMVYREVLDIIYPPKEECIVCENAPFIGVCPCCKSEINKAKRDNANNISYGFYGGGLKKLILEFKYKGNFTAGDVLSQFLYEVISEENIMADIICYVPMTKKAIKRRGFNQCKIIANNISYYADIPVSHCLRKVKSTEEQKTLTKDKRILNVKGVFNIKNNNEINNKKVLLIDDVVTTGSTTFECKKILKKYGAKEIIVLTLAKSNI